MARFTHRELVFQAEHMTYRRSEDQDQIEVGVGRPCSHVAFDELKSAAGLGRASQPTRVGLLCISG